MSLSDHEIMDVMGAALAVLGTADGESLRGNAALHAARQNLATLIMHLNSPTKSNLGPQFDISGPKTDPSKLQ